MIPRHNASSPSPLRGRQGGGVGRQRGRSAFASLRHPHPLPVLRQAQDEREEGGKSVAGAAQC